MKKNSIGSQWCSVRTGVIRGMGGGIGFFLCLLLVTGWFGSSAVAEAQVLAEYRPIPVTIQPDFPEVEIAADLANVINLDQFYLWPEAWEMLEQNGFVVVPWGYSEYFPIYQFQPYDMIPGFITADSLLHNVHLMFSYLLRNNEQRFFLPTLRHLSREMLNSSLRQYLTLIGTEWENAARRTVGFFAVGYRLLDPEAPIPEVVRTEVEAELALIEAQAGINESPVMNLALTDDLQVRYPGGTLGLLANKEDYSQYIPRGHYDKTEDLQRYFQGMMWYGRLTFRFSTPDELRSAVLITILLNEKETGELWESLSDPISFLVGVSDDITHPVFSEGLEEVYGAVPDLTELINRPEAFVQLEEASREMEPPRLNSLPIFDETLQPDRTEAIQGFRFLGQRFTVDADIFQRLVYRDVQENPDGERRMLPSGLDIPAAFGSDEALSILEEMGETEYAGYRENMNTLRESLAELPFEIWTQNFYWSWMYSLLPLITEKTDGYPSFMYTRPWLRKELAAFLGSWAELKHDTVLYAKQVYAQMGGAPPEERDDRGFVEPYPELYGRVASLIVLVREGLDQIGFLEEADRVNLARLEEMALMLKTISEKQLTGVLPTDEEFDFIRYYGGNLEHFWLETHKDLGVESISQLSEQPAALITDVATDPEGRVLQVGTGHVAVIYVVVPVEGTLRIAEGGTYTYYEFPWPMDDRLTDARWRQMLLDETAPDPPEWTREYIVYRDE